MCNKRQPPRSVDPSGKLVITVGVAVTIAITTSVVLVSGIAVEGSRKFVYCYAKYKKCVNQAATAAVNCVYYHPKNAGITTEEADRCVTNMANSNEWKCHSAFVKCKRRWFYWTDKDFRNIKWRCSRCPRRPPPPDDPPCDPFNPPKPDGTLGIPKPGHGPTINTTPPTLAT